MIGNQDQRNGMQIMPGPDSGHLQRVLDSTRGYLNQILQGLTETEARLARVHDDCVRLTAENEELKKQIQDLTAPQKDKPDDGRKLERRTGGHA